MDSEKKWLYRALVAMICVAFVYIVYLLTPVWKPVIVSIIKVAIPFIIAGLFAYLLHPVIDFLERKGTPRVLSVLIIYTFFFRGGAWLLIATGPVIFREAKEFVEQLPAWMQHVESGIGSFHRQVDQLPPLLHNQVENSVERLEAEGASFVEGLFDRWRLILEGIAFLFLLPFATFYILKDLRIFEKAAVFLIPKRFRETGVMIVGAADHAFGSYIRGQLLVSVCVGVLSIIGLWLVGVPYPIVLGLFLGMMDLIPYFGPILGAVPALVIAFTISWQTTLFTLVVILVIQQIEGNVLSPFIVGKSVHLHPLMILFALLIGYEFAGIIGLLLSVPLFVIGSHVIHVLREERKVGSSES
ncbi:LOW QUALITY PROTEIN: membrane protein YrrI [Geomicrobium sp. JCM 19039]|nr:LOW QUALITY PROTEIN: membrane protein YrrI [Geomicrobium sp. JCM 19039]